MLKYALIAEGDVRTCTGRRAADYELSVCGLASLASLWLTKAFRSNDSGSSS